MDPVTHLLTGLTLAQAGARRLAPRATAVVALGAVLPDIDFIYTYGAIPTYLEFHRGWTHSLAGIAGLGVVLAVPFWHRARRQPSKPHSESSGLRKLLLAAWLGLASHLLLDWATASGVRFFWPLRGAWYALDWFSITDPWVLALLLLGLAVPFLFRLIAEEIGARASARGAQRGAWAGMVLFLLLCAVRGTLHGEAVAMLDAQTYRGRTPLSVGAFPTPVNPFSWRGVVGTDSTYELVDVQLGGPARGPSLRFTHYKPPPSPVLEAVETSGVGRVFLAWARFPLAHIESIPNGHRVVLRDLRFAHASGRRRRFIAWIELDSNLRVVDEGFSFSED